MGQQFAGIFFERAKLYVSFAESTLNDDEFSRRALPIPRDTTLSGYSALDLDKERPLDSIRDAVRTILANTNALRGIGIGCFGPFRSLNAHFADYLDPENTYGVLTDRADPPLSGLSLHTLIKQALHEFGPDMQDVPVLVHTDATAGAVAEAFHYGVGDEDVLVYIFMTEGVGGGFVIGQTPAFTRHHSEMGLIHVRYHPADTLKTVQTGLKKSINEEGNHNHSKISYVFSDVHSLSEGEIGKIADLSSIHERIKDSNVIGEYSTVTAYLKADERTLVSLAYYYAQLCMAVVATLAPSKIVLGGEVLRQDFFVNEIRKQFKELQDGRPSMSHPDKNDEEAIAQLILPSKNIEFSEGDGRIQNVDRHVFGPAYMGALADSIRRNENDQRHNKG